MSKLNIIPYPNKVTELGGSFDLSEVDPFAQRAEIDPSMGEEAYSLYLLPTGMKIKAGSPRGAFYAQQTLAQLCRSESCPCLKIEDSPAFPYRGFMLDCARHMTTLDNIKKLIDAAAMVKMNFMHWHLTDDQGWRVEIDSHPELCSIGSRRERSEFGQYFFDEEYSGFFTKDEIREVVAYAAEKYIEVVPEFDVPGHTLSVLAAYPELSCTGGEFKVGTRHGIYDDILCAGNEDSFKLVFDVIEEMLQLFPGRFFHIGGDEAPKQRWASCPKCQAKIKELGLKNEEELQGWFDNRVAEFLKNHGKRAVAWNECLNSGILSKDCLVQRWSDGKNRTVDFANEGGNIIISEFAAYYVDYPYGMTPLRKTYSFEPLIDGLSEEGKKNVLGVETPIWTEYVRDFEHLCYMCFPRFTAVAEAGWTQSRHRNLESFMRRLTALTPAYEAIGITPAPHSDWNPGFFKSLVQMKRFFKGTFDFNSFLNSWRSTKK